jgi:diaminohydroxyphosphoribosylaminopyrimidine deaminase/5-amino-6-(5-phosphoribosylamino)uracil reductase
LEKTPLVVIYQNKIPNVVIGTVDPNVKVAGNELKTNGRGHKCYRRILEDECNELNKRFFTRKKKKTLHYFKMGRKSGWFYRIKKIRKSRSGLPINIQDN